MARAGRSGTAYSILCPDEIAYLIDLHLFLDKPLCFDKPAIKQEKKEEDLEETRKKEGTVHVGRIPQDLLSEENNFVRGLLQIKQELVINLN